MNCLVTQLGLFGEKFKHRLCMIVLSPRTPDKMGISISIMTISSPNLMLNHLLESSLRYDSNKWSNIGFSEEITQVSQLKVYFMHLNWSSDS